MGVKAPTPDAAKTIKTDAILNRGCVNSKAAKPQFEVAIAVWGVSFRIEETSINQESLNNVDWRGHAGGGCFPSAF
jgi:hypothetical protein